MMNVLAEISSWPRRLLVMLVRGYRLLLKPWLGNACRFEPTCSAYALQALERHGAIAGTALTSWRILRCHPWCDGGCDPVPQNLPRPVAGLFTRLGPNPDAALPPDPGPPHSPTRKLP
jgi:putative membrane protein insertion efficiency factor